MKLDKRRPAHSGEVLLVQPAEAPSYKSAKRKGGA